MKKTLGCFLVLLLLLASCSKEKGGGGSKSSSYNNTDSHNTGTACMSCHSNGSDNGFWWTVAGTVYRPGETDLNPNGTVYLFKASDPTGTPVLTLPVDAKGNFYTTGAVDFSIGLIASVKSNSGVIEKMTSVITSGNCNSCHISGKRIFVN